MSKALFDENADATIARTKETYATRGGQYGDTWRHGQFLCLKAAYTRLTGRTLTPEHCAALASAAMIDIKYQRSEGGYKDDTHVDAIAYHAFHAEEMRKLLKDQ